MSYIARDTSPFCSVLISGSNVSSGGTMNTNATVYGVTKVFDTPSNTRVTFNATTDILECDIDAIGIAHISTEVTAPLSNGAWSSIRNYPETDQYLLGFKVSSQSNAVTGMARGRSDDCCFSVNDEHSPRFCGAYNNNYTTTSLTKSSLTLEMIGV